MTLSVFPLLILEDDPTEKQDKSLVLLNFVTTKEVLVCKVPVRKKGIDLRKGRENYLGIRPLGICLIMCFVLLFNWLLDFVLQVIFDTFKEIRGSSYRLDEEKEDR